VLRLIVSCRKEKVQVYLLAIGNRILTCWIAFGVSAHDAIRFGITKPAKFKEPVLLTSGNKVHHSANSMAMVLVETSCEVAINNNRNLRQTIDRKLTRCKLIMFLDIRTLHNTNSFVNLLQMIFFRYRWTLMDKTTLERKWDAKVHDHEAQFNETKDLEADKFWLLFILLSRHA